jgi:hypothetical protein
MSITPSESGEDGITPSTEGTYDVFWSSGAPLVATVVTFVATIP